MASGSRPGTRVARRLPRRAQRGTARAGAARATEAQRGGASASEGDMSSTTGYESVFHLFSYIFLLFSLGPVGYWKILKLCVSLNVILGGVHGCVHGCRRCTHFENLRHAHRRLRKFCLETLVRKPEKACSQHAVDSCRFQNRIPKLERIAHR